MVIEKDYSYEEIKQFYKLYLTEEFDTKIKFIERMLQEKVSTTDSELIWKCFDMATEQCLEYGNIIQLIKGLKVKNDKV